LNITKKRLFALGAAIALTSSMAIAADYSDHRAVLGVAEIITDPLSGEEGRVIWFQKDLGNGQLSHDFVPNDPRAAWKDTAGAPVITNAIKEQNVSGDTNLTNQVFWLYESAMVWERKTCSKLVLDQFAGDSGMPGLVENFFAAGVIDLNLIQADVTQVGFRGVGPIFPPGTSTLGVAYTLFWVDAEGNLTDINGDGKIDAALREIYYNDQYEWADNGLEGRQDDGSRVFDFPTVAIHESGHGLSAAHFGNIGVKDGFLFAKPRSVMNAIYGGTLRDLRGRDVGSHCSNWAQWPLN
jgi:hypothetical protein